ncbi:MAG: DEAD/DEAH box helicase, partial [Candidatus Bipolaricaulis sp.]|nr:DEAD/DEAH box helicase [Candidatus Bipolaricaulis sp.]
MMSALTPFHPVVARWFADNFAEPTPAQRLGWPRIAAGEHTLILAPTGSGKTLAAFLYALSELVARDATPRTPRLGIHTLYVSPLRALAADIERNLEAPLREIRARGKEMGAAVGDVRVAIRTGDTPASERQRMVRRPPDVLITTPESLHLLLTSVRAREILRTVRYVIVDEIHAMCSTKRGSFLTLLLERVEAAAAAVPVRIGLSATQRPLDRIAGFLGGREADGAPRPVAVVDAGMRKNLDLAVVGPVADMTRLPATDGEQPTIWPAIYDRLVDWVDEHASTLVFANNRRSVERIAAEMNRRIGHDAVRAHHGSVSKPYRQEIERELKAGRLPALVATSSLELGIDMGAIDLVCQVETPPSVASALQRVGRAGHVYRETSVGRMLPKTREDLWRMAAMARAMRRGEISEVRIPKNPLDVLAQQVVAMVSMDDWDAGALFARIRRAEPYRELPRTSYDAVLEMVSGRYSSPLFPGLRARVAWERATNTLRALPGARHAAIFSGGTIPDAAQYPMVLEDGARLGELDEEFVFERRVGDSVVLGTGRWTILEIRHDRVVVRPSDGGEAQMPFWKGEGLGHDVEFGERLGVFTRECEARATSGDLDTWLQEECALDAAAAENLARYVRDQLEAGRLPSERTVLVDVFPNEVGDPRIAILSTFGRSFHLALWFLLRRSLRGMGQEPPEAVFSNAGILVRPGALGVDAILTALAALSDEDPVPALIEETESTPYFALRFRRNAARAMLLPRSRPGKRIPLWLQRLRSHDLLEYASRHPRFPLVAETQREIVEDDLPLGAIGGFLSRVRAGEAEFAVRRGPAPTPFAASLLFDFVGKYLYEADEPVHRSLRAVDRDAVSELLAAPGSGEPLVSADAVRTMEERLQGLSPFHRARDGVEAVELLRRLGDLTEEELRERCEPGARDALRSLREGGRIVDLPGPGTARLIAAEDVPLYASDDAASLMARVERYIAGHAGRTEEDVVGRVPGAEKAIAAALTSGSIVIADLPGMPAVLVDRDVLLGMRRLTLAGRRRQAAVASADRLAAAVLRHHHVTDPVSGPEGLRDVLGQLAGWALPMPLWHEVLRARIADYRASDIEGLVRCGRMEWRGVRDGGVRKVAFSEPELAALVLPAPSDSLPSDLADRV